MKESRSYAREKRKIQDRCNICGRTSDLTWDHVPPYKKNFVLIVNVQNIIRY